MNYGAPGNELDRFRQRLASFGVRSVLTDRPHARPREHMPTLDEIAEADAVTREDDEECLLVWKPGEP